MKKRILLYTLLLSYTQHLLSQVVTASFNAPDTVCRNQSITITNTSTNGTTYNWDFCKDQPTQGITGVNLGSLGLNRPTNFQVYKDGNNYIGFDGHEQTGGGS